MYVKAAYSDDDNRRINKMRLAGASWPDIAAALGRTGKYAGNNIRQHARHHRFDCIQNGDDVRKAPPPPPPPMTPKSLRALAGPDPLPPLHPISWGAIQ